MMNCKQASHLISQSQDVRLTWRQQFWLRVHLLFCDACTQFSRQLALLREVIRQVGRRIENDERVHLSDDARCRMAGEITRRKHAIDEARQNPDQNFTD